ncbi:unnamed protein product [Darwinula stevensoni]|uniref:Actin maturation protease n=1 Tax=Darwinula stevensoni TaxID=69355 RepID=A0A7R9A8N2_9CRUS|nr:unnamed protein product [Darwinula stevensoni]CAG0896620.1 unnamed protein product [Darwinula stevensoni]
MTPEFAPDPSLPPPPPPPPPPPIPSCCALAKCVSKSISLEAAREEAAVIDVDAICQTLHQLSQREAITHGYVYFNSNIISPLIQDGPQQPVKVDEVMKCGKALGITRYGEMFSASALATLASRVFSDISSTVFPLSDRDLLFYYLSQGCPVLVPYDADGNHAPCLKRGKKAHWALILGCTGHVSQEMLIFKSQEFLGDTKFILLSSEDLLHLPKTAALHVLAVQGKSRHLQVWEYEALKASNENLLEAPSSPLDFVFPDGDIVEGPPRGGGGGVGASGTICPGPRVPRGTKGPQKASDLILPRASGKLWAALALVHGHRESSRIDALRFAL